MTLSLFQQCSRHCPRPPRSCQLAYANATNLIWMIMLRLMNSTHPLLTLRHHSNLFMHWSMSHMLTVAFQQMLLSALESLHWNPDIHDEDLHLSLDLLFAVSTGSEEIYRLVHEGILCHYPDSKILSYEQIKTHVSWLSGVTPILNDMCWNPAMLILVPLQTMMSVLFAQNHVITHMSLLRVGDKKGTPAWVLDYSYRPISSGTEGLPTEFSWPEL